MQTVPLRSRIRKVDVKSKFCFPGDVMFEKYSTRFPCDFS